MVETFLRNGSFCVALLAASTMALHFLPQVSTIDCRQQSRWTQRSLALYKTPHKSQLVGQQRQLYARDYRERLLAITEIFELGEAGIPLLLEALRDPHGRVRALAAKCLSIFPDHPAVQSLFAAARYRHCRCRKTIRKLPQAVTALAISPDDRYLLSVYGTNSIDLWDNLTGQHVQTFLAQPSGISQAVFSHDGSYILSNQHDQQIGVWQVTTGKLVNQLAGHTGRITALTQSSDGKQLISGSWDGTIGIWDINTQQLITRLTGHRAPIYAVAISPDRQTIFSAAGDGTIRCWNCHTGRTQRIYQLGQTIVQTLAVHPTDSIWISGDRQARLSMWHTQTGAHLDTITAWTDRSTHQVMFSPDGNVIFQTCGHGINIWHQATGWLVHQLIGHRWATTALAMTSDGQRLVSGSDDKSIKFWST
jgi:WD40 repeat protein